jgi:predicted CXXCH cytochrome family protein
VKRTLLFLIAALALVLVAGTVVTVVLATPTGEAVITFPYDGMQISGTVPIRCDAAITSPGFSFYKLEFSLGETPTGWGAVSGTKSAAPEGVCDTWDTTKFPNGPAFLRLTVVDDTSNYIQDTVQVVINNGGAAAGSIACKACHAETYASWEKTKHGVNQVGCETCHGPGATHIALGGNKAYIDKVYAAGLCGTCHTEKYADWQKSLHNNHPDLAEFGRTPCVECHSAQGYVNLVFKEKEDYKIPIHLEGQTCAACHNPHSAANQGQLRFVGTSTLPSGEVINVGLAANCANCHNQRRVPSDIEGQVVRAFGRGPHEGTSSEMFEGTDAWEFPGKGYLFPSSPHKLVVTDACVTCHMKPTANAEPLHAMEPQLAACKNCHGEGVTSFQFKAKGDYDGNGKVESVQHEVEGLLELVQGVLPPSSSGWVNDRKLDTEGKRGAAYNWLFVERDRSEGVHNTLYAVALMQASYKEVTGNDVPNATLVIYQPITPPAAAEQPAGGATETGGPPKIPANHPTAGCVACHSTGVGGAPKFPENHAAFTETQCATCHQAQ